MGRVDTQICILAIFQQQQRLEAGALVVQLLAKVEEQVQIQVKAKEFHVLQGFYNNCPCKQSSRIQSHHPTCQLQVLE